MHVAHTATATSNYRFLTNCRWKCCRNLVSLYFSRSKPEPITEIQAGSCDFEGKIKYEDLTIAEKKVGPLKLLGVSTIAKQKQEPGP